MGISDFLVLFLKKVFPNWGTLAPGLALAPAPALALALALAPALALALALGGCPGRLWGGPGPGPGPWPWPGPGPGLVASKRQLGASGCFTRFYKVNCFGSSLNGFGSRAG